MFMSMKGSGCCCRPVKSPKAECSPNRDLPLSYMSFAAGSDKTS